MASHRQAPARQVSCPLPISLVTADGERLHLSGDLTFDSTDPVAVNLSICAAVDRTVNWTFARELLAAGSHKQTGAGDVRIRPTHTLNGPQLAITLISPDGQMDLELPARLVVAFLRHTYNVVPARMEAILIDWTAEFAPLLGRD
jgi:hypothetical protein